MSKATVVLIRACQAHPGTNLPADIQLARQAVRSRPCWLLLPGSKQKARRKQLSAALGIKEQISQDGIHVYTPSELADLDTPEALVEPLVGYLIRLGLRAPLRQKKHLVIRLSSDLDPLLLAAVVEAASVYPRTTIWLGERELRTHVRWEQRRDHFRSPPPAPRGRDLIGSAPALEKVRQKVLRYADKPYPILIIGETGTGKEVVANMLHEQSAREGRFMPQSAAQLPQGLADSILFGHKKGSFTGADTDRPGRIREAENGTFFLDEAFNLEPTVQGKLLRALNRVEEGIILVDSVGSTKSPVPVHTRLVVSSLQDPRIGIHDLGLAAMREDLFYRVSAGIIRLPPLRQCLDDLPKLCERFLSQIRPGLRVEEDGIAVLRAYSRPDRKRSEPEGFGSKVSWPGNIRELRLILIRALMDGPDDIEILTPDLLRSALKTSALPPGAKSLQLPCDLKHELKKIEVATMRAAMREAGKVQKIAALKIGMSEKNARNFGRDLKNSETTLNDMNAKAEAKNHEH